MLSCWLILSSIFPPSLHHGITGIEYHLNIYCAMPKLLTGISSTGVDPGDYYCELEA